MWDLSFLLWVLWTLYSGTNKGKTVLAEKKSITGNICPLYLSIDLFGLFFQQVLIVHPLWAKHFNVFKIQNEWDTSPVCVNRSVTMNSSILNGFSKQTAFELDSHRFCKVENKCVCKDYQERTCHERAVFHKMHSFASYLFNSYHVHILCAILYFRIFFK